MPADGEEVITGSPEDREGTGAVGVTAGVEDGPAPAELPGRDPNASRIVVPASVRHINVIKRILRVCLRLSFCNLCARLVFTVIYCLRIINFVTVIIQYNAYRV